MAIVSHRKRFIYLKNRKVAGASVESFFGKYCVDPAEEDAYVHSEVVDERVTPFGIIGKRSEGRFQKFWGHMSAAELRKEIGDEVFSGYTKFCVVRNPWDKIVSYFWWRYRNRKAELRSWTDTRRHFSHFVRHNISESLDWEIFTIDDRSVCDYHIRYEELISGIQSVCDLVGIDEYDISELPKFKSNYREYGDVPYTDYYDDECRSIVDRAFAKEIALFDYTF